MSQNIIEQANLLGTMLKNSEEFKEVQQKEMIMLQNPDAQKALNEHEQARHSLQSKQMQGQQLTHEDIEALRAIEAKMLEVPAIKDFNDAREKFEALLNNVNQTINRALLGQQGGCGCSSDSCSPSGGCGTSGCGC